MDTMFEDDISILTQEALGQDEDWLDSPNTDLSGEMCSASHFALITAYDDIKNRLTGLERENSTLKRRLKTYELKYPLIGEFGEEHIFSVYEAKETSLLKSEKVSLQQQLNQFQHELQKSKEREEQLDEMIQAYEKLCVEKSDLESELGEMRSLVEKHLSRIRSLEQQLRQRDSGSFGSLGAPLPGQEVPFLPLHGSPGLSHGEPRPTAPGGRPLEAEREAARQEAQRAQHREEHLKAECERLQAELKHLQETRAQVRLARGPQSERDMAWVKKVGDDQVNLALAYTELTEELCRLRSLSALQSQILRALLQEKSLNGGKGAPGAGSPGHGPGVPAEGPTPGAVCTAPCTAARGARGPPSGAVPDPAALRTRHLPCRGDPVFRRNGPFIGNGAGRAARKRPARGHRKAPLCHGSGVSQSRRAEGEGTAAGGFAHLRPRRGKTPRGQQDQCSRWCGAPHSRPVPGAATASASGSRRGAGGHSLRRSAPGPHVRRQLPDLSQMFFLERERGFCARFPRVPRRRCLGTAPSRLAPAAGPGWGPMRELLHSPRPRRGCRVPAAPGASRRTPAHPGAPSPVGAMPAVRHSSASRHRGMLSRG
uniref:TBK1 binding protein 1 n=1 Tax=Apteryx owenii TaxID=8824 RepID=A0A8B9P2A0_APTOW